MISAPANEEAERQWAHLQRIANEQETADIARMHRAVKALTERKNTWYSSEIRLRNVEGTEETADYGELVYRKWTAAEVIELLSNPFYNKSETAMSMIALKQVPPPPSKEDLEGIFSVWCDFVSRAAHPSMGLTKERLVELGNWGYVKLCFTLIFQRSGVSAELAQDLDAYFRNR